MYWQSETLNFATSTRPGVPPTVRVTEIVAAGRVHVGALFSVKVNFTGMTPRLALNVLLPSELMGRCTKALYGEAPRLRSTPTVPLMVLSKQVSPIEQKFATNRSGLRSPFTSATATDHAEDAPERWVTAV